MYMDTLIFYMNSQEILSLEQSMNGLHLWLIDPTFIFIFCGTFIPCNTEVYSFYFKCTPPAQCVLLYD